MQYFFGALNECVEFVIRQRFECFQDVLHILSLLLKNIEEIQSYCATARLEVHSPEQLSARLRHGGSGGWGLEVQPPGNGRTGGAASLGLIASPCRPRRVRPTQPCPLTRYARSRRLQRGIGALSGERHGGHLMRLDGWQYLLTKAFHVPHKQLVRHGPLVEVQHQGASAQGIGELDQRIAHLLWSAPR